MDVVKRGFSEGVVVGGGGEKEVREGGRMWWEWEGVVSPAPFRHGLTVFPTRPLAMLRPLRARPGPSSGPAHAQIPSGCSWPLVGRAVSLLYFVLMQHVCF